MKRGALSLFTAALGAALLAPGAAHASLGSSASSVDADVRCMRADDEVVPLEGLLRHDIRVPGGTVVREYVWNGVVFGVSWAGPFRPDLAQLLGPHFEPFEAAARAARSSRPGRGPLDVETPELVVQMSGHARAFHGRAYLPSLVPPGFSLAQLV